MFITLYRRIFPVLSVCGVIVTSSEIFSSECESKFIFRNMPITSTYLSLVWLRIVEDEEKIQTAKQTSIYELHKSFECTN